MDDPRPFAVAIGMAGLPAAWRILENLVGPPSQEAGEFLRDRIRSFRFERQIQTLMRAKEIAEEAGLPFGSVPLRTLVPLLDAAALEDDPPLQEMWARLLASAAAGHTAACSSAGFCEVLRQLSPTDAGILSDSFVRYGLPVSSKERCRLPRHPEGSVQGAAVAASAVNLSRLGLVALDTGLDAELRALAEGLSWVAESGGGGEGLSRRLAHVSAEGGPGGRRTQPTYFLTPLGQQFVVSVLPALPDPIEPWDHKSADHLLIEWCAHAKVLARELASYPELSGSLQASVTRTRGELDARRARQQE